MSDETGSRTTGDDEADLDDGDGAAAPAPALERMAAPEDAGGRLDRFVAERFALASRSRAKALIEAARVRRDGTVALQPSEAVRAGSVYRVEPFDPVAALPRPQAIPLTILYEDDDILVLDKPAGLVVHPAPGNEEGTLVNALLAHCGDALPGIGGERRPGIVHRLDKDTSGIMVVAKTELALARLAAAFAARDLDRAYLAVAWGAPQPPSGNIEGAIGRDPRDRKRMAVVAQGGKPALTHYRTLRQRDAAVALLECRLATGRTHQIRVHMAARGHPLVGDPVYVRRPPRSARNLPAEASAALLAFPRQALHATRLGFAHPRSGTQLAFRTPPPADMTALIGAAGLDDAVMGPQDAEMSKT